MQSKGHKNGVNTLTRLPKGRVWKGTPTTYKNASRQACA